MICYIHGCGNRVAYLAKSPTGKTSRVCRKCMQELKAVYDWKLVRATGVSVR